MRISVISDGNVISTDYVTQKAVSAPVSETSSSFEQVLNLSAGILNEEKFADYLGIFKEASATYGVDVNLLIAMAKQESNFNPNAVSSSGAMGIMQLMPFTAEEMGVENAFDPYENIMGGAKYIAQKLSLYNGSIPLALAAYNAGSGAVAQYNGIPPYAETRNYVKKIMGYMNLEYSEPVLSAVETGKKEIAAKVEKLLAEFSNHESYDEFVELLNKEITASQSEEGSSADEAYQQLSAAGRALQTMLQNM